jgi:hypothetical protein
VCKKRRGLRAHMVTPSTMLVWILLKVFSNLFPYPNLLGKWLVWILLKVYLLPITLIAYWWW